MSPLLLEFIMRIVLKFEHHILKALEWQIERDYLSRIVWFYKHVIWRDIEKKCGAL